MVYGRQREFSCWWWSTRLTLLDIQTDHFREQGQVRQDAALVFHLVCSLLLLLCCNGLPQPGASAATCR